MASTYLTRTPSSDGNLDKFTFSFWLKRSKLGSQQKFLFAGDAVNKQHQLLFTSADLLQFEFYDGTNNYYLRPNRVFRDTSAWYHIVAVWDTGNATSADRIKLYVNGTRETSFSAEAQPTQNLDGFWNDATYTNYIGTQASATQHFDGLMTHIHLTDGYVYQASDFGETDSTSGIWKPKVNPSVTYGTNGFFLKFANSASLGLDSSGNTNNFTVNGTGTQTQDTPSNNFATFNPSKDGRINAGTQYTATFSNGNTTSTFSETTYNTAAFSSLAVMGGKWYTEIKCSNKGGNTKLGLFSADDYGNDDFSGTYLYDSSGTFGGSAYGNSFTTNDIIQIAFDSTNGVVWFGKNGTWQNSATQTEIENGTTTNAAATGISTTEFWHFGTYGVNATAFQANFGNGYFGTTAVASSNSDGDGLGLFEYTVPSGYYALCTKNIKNYG